MNEQEYTQRGMDTRDLGDVFVATQIEMWRQRINADNAQLGALVWELMQAEAQALQLRLDLGAAVQRADKAAIELAAVTAERDALAAQVLALQVDRSKAVKLRDETDNVIWALKPEDVPGAINWGDLGVREVQEVVNEERCWWRVVIEEADPVNPTLHAAVLAGLVALGWQADDIEIETAW